MDRSVEVNGQIYSFYRLHVSFAVYVPLKFDKNNHLFFTKFCQKKIYKTLNQDQNEVLKVPRAF